MSTNESKRKFSAVELIQGKTYHVTADFVDYDGLPHRAGEIWRFIGHNFLPYDDGLTIYIERGGQNSVFRMQWRNEAQGEVVSNFSDYVEEVS